ncbi:MAG: hypothetical protein OXI18_11245 [bacterium]|nr:hypothetical protein [bacterium]
MTVDVSPFFSDPDGGTLTYTAASSAETVLSVSLTDSNLTIAAAAAGTATVTVTATDPDGLTAVQSTGVTVEAANRAPEAVGQFPGQTMTVGETATVNVAPFFSDPDGDELSYGAESSDENVLTVGVSDSDLTITAAAAGTATVTVTATDPGGLSATQSAGVTVEAANRAPEAVGAIPAQTMTAGRTVEVDVAAFFADPDGDKLSYGVESSDPAVVSVATSDSKLTLTAVAVGTATVTATATDPGGLSATQSVEVTVTVATRAGLRDDFESSASLDDWEIANADAAVVDGILHLTATTDDRLGIAERAVDPVLTDWTIRVRMGRAANDGTVRLYWFSEHPRFRAFGVALGPNTGGRNYLFLFWDNDDESWYFEGDFSGTSNAVRDAPGEFTDVAIGWDGDEFFLMAGDTEIWRFEPNATFRAAFGHVTTIWLASGGKARQLFDWVDVSGTESSADMPAPTGAPSVIDILPEAAAVSDRKRARPGMLSGIRGHRDDR